MVATSRSTHTSSPPERYKSRPEAPASNQIGWTRVRRPRRLGQTATGRFDAGDVLNGGPGDDLLLGVLGADTLNGGPGNDDLRGGDGTDDVNGDEGDDDLRGGNGTDDCDGGVGGEVFGDQHLGGCETITNIP